MKDCECHEKGSASYYHVNGGDIVFIPNPEPMNHLCNPPILSYNYYPNGTIWRCGECTKNWKYNVLAGWGEE